MTGLYWWHWTITSNKTTNFSQCLPEQLQCFNFWCSSTPDTASLCAHYNILFSFHLDSTCPSNTTEYQLAATESARWWRALCNTWRALPLTQRPTQKQRRFTSSLLVLEQLGDCCCCFLMLSRTVRVTLIACLRPSNIPELYCSPLAKCDTIIEQIQKITSETRHSTKQLTPSGFGHASPTGG